MLNPYSTQSTEWSYVASLLKADDPSAIDWPSMYQILEAYRNQNGLYDAINAIVGSRDNDDLRNIKPLRNPANRIVEFYAAKVWSGSLPHALPIEADNEAIIEPIYRIWSNSNWQSVKQLAVRTLVTKGDLFIQVGTGESGNVYMQVVQPEYVTDYDTDERGFLKWLRIDMPQTRRKPDGKQEHFYRTEIWDKTSLRIWDNKHGATVQMERLGEAQSEDFLGDMGIDFIPFVYVPLKADPTKRAVGAYTLMLDKIDEVNRQATRLHEMMFRYNKPFWATERSGVDSAGRPKPPVNLGVNAPVTNDSDNDDDIINLPADTSLKALVPDLAWTAHIQAIHDQMEELEKDLPELAYSNLRNSDMSGRAIGLLLGDTIDRGKEARAAAEDALIKAQKMTLTIGQNLGMWSNIGTYEGGDFEHAFRERDIIDVSALDKATTFQMWASAGAPAGFALRETGYTDDEIGQYNSDADAAARAQSTNLAAGLLNARTNFNRGNTSE